MSKTIDLSDLSALSEEDLIYAHQRNLIDDEQLAKAVGEDEFELAESIHKQGGQPTPLEEVAHTGDANTAGLTTEQLERELERRRAREARETASAAGDEEDEELDYSTMSNDELRAEIARRNEGREDEDKLDLTGRKAELIAVLEEDDEDSED